jgi:hypothetical protein
MMRLAAVLLALILALPVAGRAGPPVPSVSIRAGDHPGFGRVVFDLPAGTRWTLDRVGERLTVRFSGADPVAGARPPRNVRALTAASGTAELSLVPGTHVRSTHLGNRLVLDLLDPVAVASAVAPAAKPSAAAAPVPGLPVAAPVVSPPAVRPGAPPDVSAGTPPPVTAAPDRLASAAAPAPVLPISPSAPEPAPVGPVSLAAAPVSTGEAVVLPFAASTGAAAFRRGDEAMLVFDERRPVDTGALQNNPVFSTAEIRLFPAATVLRFRLPADRALRLSHGEAGWTVAVDDQPMLRPIRPDLDTTEADVGPQLRLSAAQPGHSAVVSDPLTGGTLLIGTQREPGQGIVVSRSTPEFSLLPTWQGVAVAAVSDELILSETADGFMLRSALPRGGLALAPVGTDLGVLDDAARLTRRFDFPGLPVPALLRRLQAAVAGAGAVPTGRRTVPRIAAVQAMLALGLGAEAQAVLSLAAASDPRAAADPDVVGLSAIAALLAGRLDDSAGLDDPRLTGTDDVALWRGLRAAMLREGAPDAAAILASEIRLLLAYPAPLRSRLLPLAAETMAMGGEAEAAQRLVEARPDDAGLDFARAVLTEQRDSHAALTILDQLALSPDRLLRARAAPRAVELRLAAGDLTPAGAADAMEKLLYAWRGDAREAALRLRAAELRAQAGTPRAALAMLRELLDALPEARDALRARMGQIFTAALEADAKAPMPPLELVAMVEENPDLITEGDPGLALARRLADRLAALDLPRRAAPVLEKLVAAAAPGVVRAELGTRLAATRLLLDDPTGALSVLGATAVDALPPPVLEERVLVWARATAAQGDAVRAAAALETLDSPPALALRVQLLEQANDWTGAAAAQRRYADDTVPAQGLLTETQTATLLHLAADAAQADDKMLLAGLRDRDLARLPQGHTADMLRLLTEIPVRQPEDLPRARREEALAGGLLGVASR